MSENFNKTFAKVPLLCCFKVFLFAGLDVAGAGVEGFLAPLVADGEGVDELAVGGGDE